MLAEAWAITWAYGITLGGEAGPNVCSTGGGFTRVGSGIAVAAPMAKLILDIDGPWGWVATINYGGGFFMSEYTPHRGLQVIISIAPNGTATVQEWLIRAPEGSEGSGGTYYDAGIDEWVGSFGGSGGAGTATLEYMLLNTSDSALDVDGDNRFTQDDVDALNAVVGTGDATDPSYTDFWDFDRDGEVTASDVAVLQGLIDAGLGSGILGDYDQDGDADCADLSSMGSGWNSIIGDGNYRVEIDADLDGDNDSADYDIVYDILQPADVNDDGSVNTQDVVAYLNLFNAQDPEADINGDGVVNSIDYILFLNLWNNPC